MNQYIPILSKSFHMLQRERGFATLYIRENSKAFSEEILEYFFKTDDVTTELLDNIDNWKSFGELDHDQQDLHTSIKTNLLELGQQRQHILRLDLSVQDAFNFYTHSLISPIIQLMTKLILLIDDAHPSAINAHCFFLQWKEKVGLERSVLTRGFIENDFTDKDYIEHIGILISEQDYYKNSFLSLATKQQQRLVESSNKMPYSNTLSEIHSELKNNKDSSKLKQMNARDWFALITLKIDTLHKIEQGLYVELTNKSLPPITDIEPSNTYERLVYGLDIFKDIDANEINSLIQAGNIYQVPKNKSIVIEDSLVSHMHIILVGWVKVFKLNTKRKEVILQMLSNGEIVLDANALTQKNFNNNAKTVTDSLIFSIQITKIKGLIKSNGDFATNMLNYVATKSNTVSQEAECIKTKNTEQRVGQFLLKLQNDKKWQSNTIKFPYNKSIIASYLGMSREVLSRAISSLSKKGYVVKRDGVEVPDKYNLCEYCSTNTISLCTQHNLNKCINKSSSSCSVKVV